MGLAFFLAFSNTLPHQLIPPQGPLGLFLCIAGLSFAVWARVTLGRNWSSMAEVKKNHELIITGPYKLVRHPIYTGWLIAFIGLALTLGETKVFLAIILILVAFLIKMYQEEKLMQSEFPKEYQKYKRQTKALIPWIW
jgi:protein-S-isoprenylcysteine O-methyltransferase Ste14